MKLWHNIDISWIVRRILGERIEWIDEEWIEELIWCPSQCYRRFRDEEGNIYTAYLRWRWCDPWQFEIALGDMVDGTIEEWDFVTGDIFKQYQIYFRDDELKEAEKKAEELVRKIFKQYNLAQIYNELKKQVDKENIIVKAIYKKGRRVYVEYTAWNTMDDVIKGVAEIRCRRAKSI